MKSKPSYDKGVLVQSIETWGNVGQCLIGWNNLFYRIFLCFPKSGFMSPNKKKQLAGSIGSIGSMWMCQMGLWNSQYMEKKSCSKPPNSMFLWSSGLLPVPLVFLPIMNCIVPWYHTVDGRNRAPVGDYWKPWKWRGLTGMLPSTHWCRISQPSTVWFMGAATPLPKTSQSLWIPKLCRNKSLQDCAPQL